VEPPDDLAVWIERQYRVAAREMLRSISATHLEHRRPAFGQVIRPAPGSILASPVTARHDPEPDYFFHWLRDSAVVLGAVLELIADGTLAGEGHAIFADFVAFSLSLDRLDGRRLADDPAYGAAVAEEARRYLRPRHEMAEIHGDRVRMEARFNPDGSLDIIRWGRPQLDGAASRGLVLMRYVDAHGASPEMQRLIDADVDFTLRHAGAPSVDIWEERLCRDYYTRSLQRALLERAATRTADRERSAEMLAATQNLARLLDEHWSAARNVCLSAAGDAPPSDRDVDFAVILATLHSDRRDGPHSVADPRLQATFATLAGIFAADYAINRADPAAAPAMGRYRGDVYQSGGAFYFSTLGAAEFHYRLAVAALENGITPARLDVAFLALAGGSRGAASAELAAALTNRGDAFMATVRRFTPVSGALSEQFDQTDGRQTSARQLAWSYAAFVTAAAWRRRAVDARHQAGAVRPRR
jgi:glucoamylase